METTLNGQHLPAPTPVAEEFHAKEIVTTLQDLMVRVTKEEATPATVQAACQCAAQISALLRVHLDVERMRREDDKIRRAEERLRHHS